MIRWTATIRGLEGRRRSLAAIAAGLVAALAMPPLDVWPALAVAMPVMLLLLQSLPPRSPLRAFRLGWLFGLGYFLFALHWVAFAFFVDAATYLWMMPFAVTALAGGMALYWGLAAAAVHATGWRGLPLVLGFAVALASAEWLRGRLFTGFPWAAPGLAANGMGAVAQIASAVGMPGLTLAILMWAGLPYALAVRSRRAAALGLLALLPLAWAYGLTRLAAAPDAHVTGVALRIVQPNVPQDEKWRADNVRAIFNALKALSVAPSADYPQGIAQVSHLIWPESAVPFPIDESPVSRAELAAILDGRTVLITGALRRDATVRGEDGEPAVFNSIVAFDGFAAVVARYDKWRLVPGGEFLPLAWAIEPLGFRKVVSVPGSFTAGPGPVTVAVPGAPAAAMLICYEAIFPHDLVYAGNRPGWIVNVTNDGWFGNSSGPHQHLAQARLRAIEQGLPVVRAANTGISAVIDGVGRTRERLTLGESGVIDTGLPAALPATLYSRFGDATFAAMCLALLLLAGVSRRSGDRLDPVPPVHER
jgi:apolipoprotein N-acyltransferase